MVIYYLQEQYNLATLLCYTVKDRVKKSTKGWLLFLDSIEIILINTYISINDTLRI